MSHTPKSLGILLAGGRARRMGGGDKCLLPLGDSTLLSRSVERARTQVDDLILSANGNALRFARTKLPVVADEFEGYPGPLAGIQAGMQWMCDHRPDCEWLASFACDTPFFPRDLVEQLSAAIDDSEIKIVVASSGERMQPVFALWHKSLLNDLTRTLTQSTEIPWLQHWIADRPHREATFSTDPIDPFFNINAPQDLYRAQELLPLVS